MTEPQTPIKLTRRSWVATLKRTVAEFREDNLTDWAAALTYYAVLSIFPALIALVSLVGLVGDPESTTDALLDIVDDVGPASAVETFRGPAEAVTDNRAGAGVLLVLGLATALWTASGYVGAFTRASNAIYEVHEGRPFWKLRPLQLLVTLTTVLMIALVLIALVLTGPLARAVGDAIGVGDSAVTAWNYGKWPVLLVVVMTIVALLYYSAPNRKPSGFRWVTPGALLAIVVSLVASAGFAAYVANFGSYDETYGALAGGVSFLVWLWILNIAVLLGAELNAELERGRELEAGIPGAETEIQLPARDEPKEPNTA